MLQKSFVSLVLIIIFSVYLEASKTHYVNTKVLKVRLAPTTDAPHSYNIYKNDKVRVYETQNNWARISRYISTVKNAELVKVAKWVHEDYLNEIFRPEKKKKVFLKQSKELDLKTNTYFVNTNILKVRLAPSKNAHHSYSIFKGYNVKIFEIKNGWARISKYHPSTRNGKRIQAAKWVYRSYLVQVHKPSFEENVEEVQIEEIQIVKEIQEVENKTQVIIEKISKAIKKQEDGRYFPLLKAISKSDDYEKFKPSFIATSKRLYDSGTCKLRDFKRSRGWMELADDTIYFIYCGSIKRANKIYLNVITGKATK